MRRTISGAAIAALASVTLLAGCADDATTTDPAVDDPAVEDTMAPMDEPTLEPTDS